MLQVAWLTVKIASLTSWPVWFKVLFGAISAQRQQLARMEGEMK